MAAGRAAALLGACRVPLNLALSLVTIGAALAVRLVSVQPDLSA